MSLMGGRLLGGLVWIWARRGQCQRAPGNERRVRDDEPCDPAVESVTTRRSVAAERRSACRSARAYTAGSTSSPTANRHSSDTWYTDTPRGGHRRP